MSVCPGLRIVAAFLASACVVLAQGTGVNAPNDPQVVVTDMLGVGKQVQQGGIVPMLVRLSTQKGFAGRIVVTSDVDGSDQVVQNLDVGQGKFRFEIPYPVPLDSQVQFKVSVSIKSQSGRQVGFPQWLKVFTVAPTTFGQSALVGWISNGSAPKKHEWHLEKTVPDRYSWYGREHERVRHDFRVCFNALRPKSCPQKWTMYLGYDLVVVSAKAGNQMPTEVVRGLEKWVRCGGRLHLGKDSIDPTLVDTPFGEAFGSILWEEIGFTRREVRGLGEVVYVDRELQEIVEDARKGPLSPRTQLAERALGYKVQDKLLPASTYLYTSDYENLGDTSVPMWANSIERWIDLERISLKSILGLATLFVLIAGILERLILGKIRRLHWTWVVTPVLIVIFCFSANSLLRFARGYQSRYVVVGFHDYGAKGGGVHRSAACFVPATGGRRIVRDAGRDGIISRVSLGEDGGLAAFHQDKGELETGVPVWSPVVIRAIRAHQEPVPFDCDLAVSAHKAHGTVIPARPDWVPVCAELRVGERTYAGDVKQIDGRPVIEFNGRLGATVNNYFSNSEYSLRPVTPLPEYFWSEYPRDNQVAGHLTSLINEASHPLISRSCGFGMLPRPRSDRYAWLIVVCTAGPELSIDQKGTDTKRAHIVRQLVEVQP